MSGTLVHAQPGDAEALARAKALAAQNVEDAPQALIPEGAPITEDAALEVQEDIPLPDLEVLSVPEKPVPVAVDASAPTPVDEPPVEAVVAPQPEMVAPPSEAPPSNVPTNTPERPDATAAVNVPAIPDAPQPEFDENLFFDAEALVPASEISKKAPAKVDPSINPGSVLVVSTKTANSESKEAQLVAAERARKLGRHESALEIYETLYKKNKRDPNVLMGRAATLQSLGRVDEAIKAYQELLTIRPENVNAQINMQGLIGKHYPAVAMRSLQDLYNENPSNVGVIAQLAVMEAQMGRYEEAVRYLGMAASMEPQNANHLYNMAVIADRSGDKKAAIQYYEDSLEVDTLYGAGRSIPRESVFERLAQLR